jgi:hypothetical protein
MLWLHASSDSYLTDLWPLPLAADLITTPANMRRQLNILGEATSGYRDMRFGSDILW